jgi:hypothetical protein
LKLPREPKTTNLTRTSRVDTPIPKTKSYAPYRCIRYKNFGQARDTKK